jgi:hypothetical protein
MKFVKLAPLAFAASLAASAVSAQVQCSGFRSVAGDFPATLTFSNQAESGEDSFIIYWMNFEGKPVQYAHIFQGESFSVNTYIYHPWIVTSPIPGGGEICVGSYMPDPSGREIVLW